MKTAVVFYSKDGNTKFAAKEIAAIKQAELYELIEKKGSRKGFFGFMKCGFQASTKKQSAVQDDFSEKIKPCDTVFIGSPVWAGNSTPAVNTFVNHADFAGKDVYLFFLCASKEPDYKPKGGIDYISDLVSKKGGKIKGTYVFTGTGMKQPLDEALIREQIAKAQL